MTLSNFDWTDKDSVKWFIILPTGHEGPYSLKKLEQLKDQKKIAQEVKVWAEGLPNPVTLKEILKSAEEASEEFLIPDLPPIPDTDIPPIPLPDEDERPQESIREVVNEMSPGKRKHAWVFITITLFIMLFFAFGSLIENAEIVTLKRLPKMSLNLQERILKENSFEGWDKKIFFKEYLPDDHSHIWLVTSSFHQCEVNAIFNSLPDKMLSNKDQVVSFKTRGALRDHVVEFSSLDFTQGNKIIPGMYEMDVRASQCDWDGLIPRVMNKFSRPDETYQAKIKVVLFSKGPAEFNTVLDRLLKKKFEKELKEQSQNELFWQNLQQKLETLQAVTLQIEHLLVDFLDKPAPSFFKNRDPMIDQYTRQFGSFLTSFVVENESYFRNLNSEAKGSSQKRNYELMVKLTSKRIGLESMKFIEEFQKMKNNPNEKDLQLVTTRVKKAFSAIKNDIIQKLSQVSEDRSQ